MEFVIVFALSVALLAVVHSLYVQSERKHLLEKLAEAEKHLMHSSVNAAGTPYQRELVIRYEALLEEERLRVSTLLTQILSLKADGFVTRPQPPHKEPVSDEAPSDEVQKLLVSYPDEFRAQTTRWVRERRSSGMSWEAIAAHLSGHSAATWKRPES